MSMLVRYKKTGGFLQLVKLIEGFGHEKQEKFLDMIEKEDKVWSDAVKGKILSVEKIFSWDEQIVGDIVARMHEKNVAAMMHGLDEYQKGKVFSLKGHSEKRRLESAMGEMEPSAGEIATAKMKLIEETRELITSGFLRIDKFDPSLIIEENIEESLATAAHFSGSGEGDNKEESGGLDFSMATAMGNASPGSGVDTKDYQLLRQKVVNLTKEVNQLKKENQNLNSKLAQIRKIA